MAGRSAKPSEFAGKPGLIQSVADGHVEMTAREAAFVMRRQGFSDVVGRTFPEQDAIDETLGRRGEPAVPVETREAVADGSMLPAEPLWGRGIHNEGLAAERGM